MNVILKNNFIKNFTVIKILIFLFLINLFYNLFYYFFFIIVKSVFPIVYVGWTLKLMNDYTIDKPLNFIFKKIDCFKSQQNHKNSKILTKIETDKDSYIPIPKIKEL